MVTTDEIERELWIPGYVSPHIAVFAASRSAAAAADVDRDDSDAEPTRVGSDEKDEQSDPDEEVPIGDLSDEDLWEDSVPRKMTNMIGDARAEAGVDHGLTKVMQREIMRINRNLGHPGTEALARALRHAGCRPEVISWARNHFKDPIRDGRSRPKPPRPAVLPRAPRFNQVIGSDLIFLEYHGVEYTFLNTVCWGTGLQQLEICRGKKSDEVLEAFMNGWVKHYGWPEMVVCDQGPEYTGHKWQDYLGDHGILVHLCDSQSP